MLLTKLMVAAGTLFSIASAATYNVTVGNNGQLAFDPTFMSGILAGDTIVFQFPTSASHSATQSTFDTPCTAESSGLDSGITTSSSSPPDYSAVISDVSAPLWFFCKVDGHCKTGMVFGVNPTTAQSYDDFKARAMGQSVPSGSSSASATATSAGSSAAPSGKSSSGITISIQKMTAGIGGLVLLGLLA